MTVVATMVHGPKQVQDEGVTDDRTGGDGACESSVEGAYETE